LLPIEVCERVAADVGPVGRGVLPGAGLDVDPHGAAGGWVWDLVTPAVLSFDGLGAPPRDFYLGGFQVGLSAVEVLCRQLAAQLGPHGVRVVTLQSAGIIDSFPPDIEGAQAIKDDIVGKSMLGLGATLKDVGNVAAFAASDKARTLTATAINITCGAEV
jgi:3-oxoacyl-[acyl-carrier protein] reductase